MVYYENNGGAIMVTLSKGGAFLINGNQVIEDNENALSEVKKITGKDTTCEQAAKWNKGLFHFKRT